MSAPPRLWPCQSTPQENCFTVRAAGAPHVVSSVPSQRKCGLGGSEYIAKTFRLAIPSYEDEEWEGKGKGKGKGKRLSPQQGRGGAGAQIEPSPTLTTTSRLGVPGSSSPLPQEKAGKRPHGCVVRVRLEFGCCALIFFFLRVPRKFF